ncbi:hypothetical protein BC831DRAFT_458072 [Entophlyctis helioformis]|nr:hypothetical protein BC831DRAFT_458072 [Entophlyctis helioformis]
MAASISDSEHGGQNAHAASRRDTIEYLLHLYRFYPATKWFALVPDTAFVFLDHLEHILSRYTYTKPHYFGRPSVVVNSTVVKTSGRRALNVAQSESGIVLSREAVKRLHGVKETCDATLATHASGDVRLALCLAQAGIRLTPLPGLYPYLSRSSTAGFDFTQDSCSVPVVYQPATYTDMALLHDLVLDHRVLSAQSLKPRIRTPVILQDILRAKYPPYEPYAHPYYTPAKQKGSAFPARIGPPATITLPAQPRSFISKSPSASGDHCATLCASTPRCLSYFYTLQSCSLFASVPAPPVPDFLASHDSAHRQRAADADADAHADPLLPDDFVAGILHSKYACKRRIVKYADWS